MGKNIKSYQLVLLLIIVLFCLTGCGKSAESEMVEACESYGLTNSKVSLNYKEKYEEYKVYDAIITCDGFSSLSGENMYKCLYSIRYAPSEKILIYSLTVKSDGHTYALRDETKEKPAGVKCDGEEIYTKEASNDSNQSTKTSSTYSGSYDAVLREGSGSIPVFASEDAMDRYMTAVLKDYQGTIDEMNSSGEVAYIEQNTKCNIVEEKITRTKVKLLDGIYAGNTVWVVNEVLQKK